MFCFSNVKNVTKTAFCNVLLSQKETSKINVFDISDRPLVKKRLKHFSYCVLNLHLLTFTVHVGIRARIVKASENPLRKHLIYLKNF